MALLHDETYYSNQMQSLEGVRMAENNPKRAESMWDNSRMRNEVLSIISENLSYELYNCNINFVIYEDFLS